VTDATGATLLFDSSMANLGGICRDVDAAGGKLMFIGNGGSASIASHMAVDFTKNGAMRAVAFNDPMVLTCLSNDLGYENVFSFQIERYAVRQDLLFAISSSGRSANILNGAAAARQRGARVVTMTGFDEGNPLRARGDLNFYVPASEYGFVELLHTGLCHCILDGLVGVKAD
jgi:D-sedoheptulose 7-phosphate isomerase